MNHDDLEKISVTPVGEKLKEESGLMEMAIVMENM